MRTLSRKSFAIGLLLALLVCSASRAVPVFALADPSWTLDVAPVYETQIYQLQDYVNNNLVNNAPQLEVFYLLYGSYVAAMASSEDYQLTNPFANQDGVLNWLKDCGVQAYNTLISLAPVTIQLPDGSFMSTDRIKRSLSALVANAMGCAVKATQYNSVQEFKDDLRNNDHYFMPWNSETQYGLNTMFQTFGGIYNWQFNTIPFTSNIEYRTANMSQANINIYNNTLDTLDDYDPIVRFNWWNDNASIVNCAARGELFSNFHNLFYDIDDHRFTLRNALGQTPSTISGVVVYPNINVFYDSNYVSVSSDRNYQTDLGNGWSVSDYSTIPTIKEIVQRFYDFHYVTSGYSKYYFEDFVEHVYVGDSWANRTEIYNIRDLNLEDSDQPYYVTVPDTPEEPNYLLDIKGILQDILNNTDLYNVFINHIYTPDGVLVHDTDLIRVSIELLDYYQEQNPPIPVNLNDIAEYTDNSYLDLVKEEAKRGGNTLAALVAFWHNCDAELVYVLFGAGITVLVGAFIGKWGHS